MKNLVEKALAGLSDTLRIPLVFSVYRKWTLAKSPRPWKIPEGTVKSRLFTARKQMKEFIQNAG